MTIKLAIFDFDGTLADSFPLFAAVLGELAVRHRFRRPANDEVGRMRELSATEILRELGLPLWRVPAVLADFREIMQRRLAEVRPFDGIDDALHAVAATGVRLALATSNSRRNVEAVLGGALIDRFAAVECGAALFGKAQRLRRILRTTGTDEADAIYVGDEIRDAHAAGKAGVRFGAVAWGYTEFRALTSLQPAAAFGAPRDLLTLTCADGV